MKEPNDYSSPAKGDPSAPSPQTSDWLRRAMGRFVHAPDTELALATGVSPQAVARWVEGHGLEGVFCRLLSREEAMAPFVQGWRKRMMAVLWQNLRALGAAVKFFALMDNAGIEAAGMRGIVMAHRDYHSPGLRAMRDVDILVRADDRLRIEETMTAAGHPPVQFLRSQDIYELDGVTFEVHWSLLTAKRYRSRIDEDGFLATRCPVETPDGRLYALPDEYELIGLVTHAFIHHELTIVKQLLDIALFMARPKLDWTFVRKWCDAARMTRMFALTLDLVNLFFNLKADRMLDAFCDGISRPAHRRLQAYIDPFFGRCTIGTFLQSKQNLLYAAENPLVKLKQLIGFFSMTEIRDIRRRYFGSLE